MFFLFFLGANETSFGAQLGGSCSLSLARRPVNPPNILSMGRYEHDPFSRRVERAKKSLRRAAIGGPALVSLSSGGGCSSEEKIQKKTADDMPARRPAQLARSIARSPNLTRRYEGSVRELTAWRRRKPWLRVFCEGEFGGWFFGGATEAEMAKVKLPLLFFCFSVDDGESRVSSLSLSVFFLTFSSQQQ